MKNGARVMTLQCSGFGNRFGRVDNVSACKVYVEFNAALKMCDFTTGQLAEVPWPMTSLLWATMTEDEQRSYVQEKGKRIGCTTNVADELTYGFGKLDANGFWEYPCPWYKPTPSTAKEGE